MANVGGIVFTDLKSSLSITSPACLIQSYAHGSRVQCVRGHKHIWTNWRFFIMADEKVNAILYKLQRSAVLTDERVQSPGATLLS
jgi:hypothetical protein